MKKNILSLILITIMSLSIVGCNDKTDDNTSTTEINNINISSDKDYYLAALPDNLSKVTHRGYGLGVVTINGYSDVGIKIGDYAISSNYINENGIAEGSFTVYVSGYTEEEAKMYCHKVDLEFIKSSYGNDEGVVEIYEEGDYIIYVGQTTKGQGYYIRCFTKQEEGEQLGASVHIHCKEYDKETVRKYLAKLSYSLVSEDDEEYIVDTILKYTNSKGWFTLKDSTLVSSMRETTITYNDLRIESYKDKAKESNWELYEEINGFTVYVNSNEDMFYFCKDEKCYFSVENKDYKLERDDAWKKIKENLYE